MKLTEAVVNSPTRVLITGLPGSGKSTLATDLAKEGFHLIWISLDNDIDVLKKLSPQDQESVDVFNIPDSAAFPVGSATCLQLFKELKGGICRDHGVWNCPGCKKVGRPVDPIDISSLQPRDIVVLDTATQLGNSILAHVTKGKPADYKPERDDWGALRKFTEFFCSQFQAFRGNLIVICHIVEAELEDDRTKLVPNFGSKGMSAMFAKAFSEVVYCEVVNKTHRAFSSSTATTKVLTKSRTDWAIEDLPKPSLAPVFQRSLKSMESGEHNRSEESPRDILVSEGNAPTEKPDSAIDLLAKLKKRIA